ncbi:MAG: histidine kinase [Saprospiraceae bacterium]|nr:histidine kinase [Saprospiraceae bacterium]
MNKATVVLVLLSTWLNAQQASSYFRNYSTIDGLPSPEVHCIYQDLEGFMWFGTDNGVARFDGYNFVLYDATNGLVNNMIIGIREDENGKLWFTALDGSTYLYDGKTIVPSKYNQVLDHYRTSYVDAFFVGSDDQGNRYFNLVGFGVLKISSDGISTIHHGSRRNAIAIYQDENFATATFHNWSHERRIASDEEIVLELYKGIDSLVVTIPLEERVTTGYKIFQVAENEFILSLKGFLYLIADNSIRWKSHIGSQINAVLPDLDGGYWLGLSHNNGLRYYKGLKSIVDEEYNVFLANQTITAIYADLSGGIWVSSHDAGVFYCTNPSMQTYNFEEDGSNHIVTSLSIKSESEIYIGCADGSVALFQVNQDYSQYIPHTWAEGTSRIFDLFYDRERGILWSDNEFYQGNQIVTTLRSDNRIISIAAKKYHYDINDHDLWLIKGWGFYKIDLDDPSIIINSSDYIAPTRIYSIYADVDGRIWTGSNSGLSEWVDNRLQSVEVDHMAFHSRIEDIDAFDRKHLILGTKGYGVVIWYPDTILTLNTTSGLASNMIEDVHVDENNIAWIATLNGLSKITLDSNHTPKVRTFTIDNGLPSNEIYQIKSYMGQPWLCTGGGLVKWTDPPFDSTSYTPRIQKIWVNGEESSGNAHLFKHEQNNLTFDFLTVDYQQFGNINYRYRLASGDEWINTKNHAINFARLAPGSYQFEVQSQNKDGMWSQSTCYGFVVDKPWYGRWWFFATSLFVGILLIYFLLTWWIKRKEEKISVKREMDELKKSALQAQMNPHFIFNCLNSIQGYVNAGKREEANSYLLNFSHLIRGCLNASIDREISLAQDIAFIENYLNLEKMRFSPEFDYEIKVTPGVDPERIYIEPMLVLPFVENAVIHGLSRSDRQGRIYLKYEMVDEIMQVTIEDNGPGLGKSNYQASSHKSVGITITRKRLQLINRESNSSLKMNEILENGEIQGTRVILMIDIYRHKYLDL